MPVGGIDLQSASAPEPLDATAFVIHATKKGTRKVRACFFINIMLIAIVAFLLLLLCFFFLFFGFSVLQNCHFSLSLKHRTLNLSPQMHLKQRSGARV